MKRVLFSAFFLIASTVTAGTQPAAPAFLTKLSEAHGPADPNVTRLSGPEAMARIQERSGKHPGPFGRAVEALKKRGFQPTTQAWAVLHSAKASGPVDSKNGIQLAQYSWSGDEGEIDFWSWDDGDNGTWEGVLYAENYDTGVAVTFDLQINIEVDGNYWTVFSDCTGAERNGQPYEVKTSPAGGQDSGIRLASLNAESRFLPALLSSMNVKQAPGHPYELVLHPQQYFGCAFWGCLAVAVGCAFLGPGAPPCFFAACTAVLVACLRELF